MNFTIKEYKGFKYVCENEDSEKRLVEYIDSLGENPIELPSVSQENYECWKCEYDFSGVKYLELPLSIKNIGKCVFAQSKIENLVADGVEHVDELAFYQTRNLEKVSLANCKSLVSLDPETGEPTEFSDCFNHSCVSELYIPNVEVVGRYCFYDMPKIKSLELPNVVHIESHSIFGCENLARIDLSSITHLPISAITMNEKLDVLKLSKLETASVFAMYGNGDAKLPFGVNLQSFECVDGIIDTDKLIIASAKREKISYMYEYKGFKFNLVETAGEKEFDAVVKQIDRWLDMGIIDKSPNIDANESGHETMFAVKDIYIPNQITAIDDYAFSKCYGLSSVVAPAVKVVGEHAFYCDGELRYVDLQKCETITHDAFNGAGCNYADQVDSVGDIAKIFIPEARQIGLHAFWFSGYRVVLAPECEMVDVAAFEENAVLQVIWLKNAKANAFIGNKMLKCAYINDKKIVLTDISDNDDQPKN